MADNVLITAGSGTTIHADEYTHSTLGAGKTQLVKLVDGALDSGVPIVVASGVAANALRIVNSTDDPVIGATNETAPVSDTATSGLNGRLQRIAQRLTTLLSSGAATLLKLEDDAHTSADAGVMALAVQKSNPTSLNADGDYTPLQTDATNRLWVRPAPVQTRITVTPTISTSVYASGDIIGGLMTFANAVRVSGGSGIIQSITINDVNPSIRAAMDLVFFDRTITVGADNAVWNVSDADMKNCLGIIPIGAYNTAFPATVLNCISTLINIGLPIVLNGTDLFVVAIIRGTPTYVGTADLTFNITILQD